RKSRSALSPLLFARKGKCSVGTPRHGTRSPTFMCSSRWFDRSSAADWSLPTIKRLSEKLSGSQLKIAKAFVEQSHYSLLLLGLQHLHKRQFQSHIRRFDVNYCLIESYVETASRRTGNERPRKTDRLNSI